MSSKATELTKVEQDALRYRVLRRLFSELKAALRIGPDVMAIGAPALDHTCDEATRLEDVAGVLIESTHPSLQLASSSSIEESCVQATREIATSLERGIYQPLLPLDAQHLLACAKLAEETRKASEQATQASQREARTLNKITEALARATMRSKRAISCCSQSASSTAASFDTMGRSPQRSTIRRTSCSSYSRRAYTILRSRFASRENNELR
jgi:hypothetical protein